MIFIVMNAGKKLAFNFMINEPEKRLSKKRHKKSLSVKKLPLNPSPNPVKRN